MLFNNCCFNKSKYKYFSICKIDSTTETPLSGAVFELIRHTDDRVCRGITNSKGVLKFCVLPGRSYTLREIHPSPGYQPSDKTYNIFVTVRGCIYIDGRLTNCLLITNTPVPETLTSFTLIKRNVEDSMPLSNASYTLYSDTVPIGNTISTETGEVTFTDLAPGIYELVETAPPIGFSPNPGSITVVVNPDGNVTIDGESTEEYPLYNTPTGEIAATFTIVKINTAGGGRLPGALYTLFLDAIAVRSMIGDEDGEAIFTNIPPGTYELAETAPPDGFLPNPEMVLIEVDSNGNVTIDGQLGDRYIFYNTPIPVIPDCDGTLTINDVFSSDTFITGTGNPGCQVFLTFPTGTAQNVVGNDCTWWADAPEPVFTGDVIEVQQTCPSMTPETISTVVLPNEF